MLAKKKKLYKVELKRRLGNPDNLVGGLIWESSWTDITEYFLERLGALNSSLDDTTLQGKIEQASVSLQFSNIDGKFNPKGTENSLWETTGYIYHSRIRFYEFFEGDDYLVEGEEPTLVPLIDGLIAEEPKYRANMKVDIRINSKLDILREHYILEGRFQFNYTSSGTALLEYISNLLSLSYSELGISIKAGVLKKEVIYENITPYSEDLLSILNKIINDGGGYGGLTRDNNFFSAYFGASLVTQTNFEDDADCIGLFYMDDTDYNGGAGTTVYDQTTNNFDLTTDNSIYNNWTTNGYFNNAVKTFYRTTMDSIWTDLTNFTIELLIKGTAYGTPRNIKPLFDANKEYTLNPIITFSTRNDSTLYLSDGISTYYEEGFYYWQSKLYYMQVIRNDVAGGYSDYNITAQIELGPILGENYLQYIAIVLDSTTNEISFHLNGKLKKYIITAVDLGVYYTAANIKFMGRCFAEFGREVFGSIMDFNDEMNSVYFSSMKFSDTLKTESEIFTQYEKLIGVSYTL